ncbi:peptide MFS transporter [Henriciella sp. AS95]|uniref:peptide MFS transporter n=1 Tax=Henriciella sp. AS95 TaxID=3135782 RepID=UPI00316D3227
MSDVSADQVSGKSGEKGFFGHPRGLVVLFFTEMWERFSFYGMRALLTLYLIQHFLYSDQESSLIYGAYISLVYAISIIGGTLSDRYLGQRKAVTYGAILLVLGHFGMAFEGSGSQQYVTFNSTEYAVEDEGRDRFRKLYIDYEGDQRQLVFDSENYATLGDRRITPMNADGEGDYRIDVVSRSLFQNVCNLVGLGCAGPDPSKTLIVDGQSYPIEDVDRQDGAVQQVALVDGQEVTFEEATQTDLLVVEPLSENADADAEPNVLLTVPDGEYSDRNEKQQLFIYILFLSLALIITGVGFLKPNISTIVGDLYDIKDPRRDSGFTLFYMGINLGSFLSTWTCGILGIYYGWAWGFGLAGIGMLVGLVTFLWLQHWLEGRAEPPNPEKLKQKVLGPINIEWACYLTGLGLIMLAMLLVMNSEVVGSLSALVGIAMFIGLTAYSFISLKGRDRTRMWAGIYFAIAQIPFWSLFEQAGSSLTLFTSRLVDTKIFGWEVPTPVFQSLNAGFIFIFAPMIAWLWVWLAKRGWEPSTPVKFAMGVFGAGLGYLVLTAGMGTAGADFLTPVFFIFAIYWVHTMAELMLSPVGLSAMTKLAPARAVGLMMGAWFVYSGLGNAMSGVIASAAGAETVGGEIIDKAAAKDNYASVFSSVGWIGMGIGVVMLLIAPIVKGWMKMSDEDEPDHNLAGQEMVAESASIGAGDQVKNETRDG